MLIEQVWLLKGFVLAHGAPATIVAAVDSLIESLTQPVPAPTRHGEQLDDHSGDFTVNLTPCDTKVTQVLAADRPAEDDSAKKLRKPWSQEAREAAAERMRARQAAGLMKKGKPERAAADLAPAPASPKQFAPASVEKLQRDHSGYAGKRDPDQELLDSDWPDIKNMLNVKRMSISQVASDYDVTFGVLRAFVDKHEAREEEQLGEAIAPSKAGA